MCVRVLVPLLALLAVGPAGGIETLNRPHRAPLRTVDVGWMRLEQFLSAGQRGRLTQCVGQRRALEPSYRRCSMREGDSVPFQEMGSASTRVSRCAQSKPSPT